jgi:hypothetical protein
MGDGTHSLTSYRAAPHLMRIGRDYLYQKFECRRCRIKQSGEGFRPIPGLDAGYSINGVPKGVYLHPFCNRCRKELKSRWIKHPKFTSELHAYFSRLLSGTKGSAHSRGIRVMIDVDDLLELYFLQDGKCAMSGYELMVQRKSPGFKDPMAASVDRIDSGRIYDRRNIQLTCARVNIMKGDMHHNDMIDWCKRILANQMRKEDELLKLIDAA